MYNSTDIFEIEARRPYILFACEAITACRLFDFLLLAHLLVICGFVNRTTTKEKHIFGRPTMVTYLQKSRIFIRE